MKTFALALLVLTSLVRLGFAEEADTNSVPKIPASEAKNFLRTNAIVTGTIAEVNITERVIRLNFDRPYPRQTFTAVIFPAKTNLFPEVTKLQGKTVEVSGLIHDYRQRPEITLESTNQLKILKTEEKAEK